jgi:hypothetical protein
MSYRLHLIIYFTTLHKALKKKTIKNLTAKSTVNFKKSHSKFIKPYRKIHRKHRDPQRHEQEDCLLCIPSASTVAMGVHHTWHLDGLADQSLWLVMAAGQLKTSVIDLETRGGAGQRGPG